MTDSQGKFDEGTDGTCGLVVQIEIIPRSRGPVERAGSDDDTEESSTLRLNMYKCHDAGV